MLSLSLSLMFTGFLLKVTPTSGKGQPFERSFAGHERQYMITDLSCGSRLELSMKAFNSIGFGDSSATLIVKTTGTGKHAFRVSQGALSSRGCCSCSGTTALPLPIYRSWSLLSALDARSRASDRSVDETTILAIVDHFPFFICIYLSFRSFIAFCRSFIFS